MDKTEKILTFDCYGTLLNTDALYDYVAGCAQAHGLPGGRAREIFAHYEDRLMYGEAFIPYGQLVQQALEYCDMELNTDIFAPQWPQVMALHEAFAPYGDVLEPLRALKARGYRLILLSNSSHALMQRHAEKLEHLPDGYVLAEDTKCYKPDLRFFAYAAEKYGLDRCAHWHIARGYWWDIVPCAKLGWNRIWVNRDGAAGSPRHQPYREITTLAALPQLL